MRSRKKVEAVTAWVTEERPHDEVERYCDKEGGSGRVWQWNEMCGADKKKCTRGINISSRCSGRPGGVEYDWKWSNRSKKKKEVEM